MRQGDRVYEQLYEAIVEWRLPPGTVLSEVELAESLSISRTPLREAIQRLSREGLVNAEYGRSATVSNISLDEVVKLFQMREALETYAARLCARRVDRSAFERLRVEFQEYQQMLRGGDVSGDYTDYYRLIGRFDEAVDLGADNTYLFTALTNLRGHLRRLRRIARRRPERMATTSDEHLAICQAICDGDEILAGQAVAVHIHNSLRNILAVLMQDVAGPSLADPLSPVSAVPSVVATSAVPAAAGPANLGPARGDA